MSDSWLSRVRDLFLRRNLPMVQELPDVPPAPEMPLIGFCPRPRVDLHRVRDRVHMVVLAEQLLDARARAEIKKDP